MTTPSRSTPRKYRVFFFGQAQPGRDIAQVRENIADVFSVSGSTLDFMFSGKPVVIKEDIDRETAKIYDRTIRRAGGIGFIDTMPESETPGEQRLNVDRRIKHERRSVPRISSKDRRVQYGRRTTDYSN